MKLLAVLSLALFVVTSEALDKSLCKCKIPPSMRIIGGEPATAHDHPWIASIGQIYSAGHRKFPHFCGGAILNSRFILTAAHCIRSYKPIEILVLVGAHFLTDYQEANVYKAKRLILHPEYNSLYHSSADFGLIELEKDIEFGDNVQPTCVSATEFDYTARKFQLVGWGRVDQWRSGSLGISNELHQVDLKFVSKDQCRREWAHAFGPLVDIVLKDAICAIDKGKDGCVGDSGGPLMWAEKGRMYTVAVVSKGAYCTASKGTIYEKVSTRMTWMKEIVGDVCEF